MVVPLYNINSGDVLGLEKSLAFTMVRDDQDEAFFFHMLIIKLNRKNFVLPLKNYCQTYSAALVSKNIRAFYSNSRWNKRHSLYLASTTNCSHAINQFIKTFLCILLTVYIKILDIIIKQVKFHVLRFKIERSRKTNKSGCIVQRLFKDLVEVSNSNIVRNASNLLTALLNDNDIDIACSTKQRVGSGKFKLNY